MLVVVGGCYIGSWIGSWSNVRPLDFGKEMCAMQIEESGRCSLSYRRASHQPCLDLDGARVVFVGMKDNNSDFDKHGWALGANVRRRTRATLGDSHCFTTHYVPWQFATERHRALGQTAFSSKAA